MIRIYIWMIALMICTTSVFAQEMLFQPYSGTLAADQQAIVDKLGSMPTTMRVRIVSIDRVAFENNALTLNFFSDATSIVKWQDIGHTGVRFETWTGNQPERLGSAAFILNGNRISGHFTSLDGNFEVAPLGKDGVHMVWQHDNSKFDACGTEDDQVVPSDHRQNVPLLDNTNTDVPETPNYMPQTAPSNGYSNERANGEECFIRLVIGYTSLAQTNTSSTYGRTMNEHVALAVVDANQAGANSGSEQRVELAHLYKDATAETSNRITDLNDLQSFGDGRFDNIHGKRNSYDGDMCAMITGGLYVGYCGRAYAFDYTDATIFFQVSEYDCIVGNFTMHHEFGHCQGLRHDTDGTNTPFSYGHGYNQGPIFRTIMAVCCTPTRVNYWSNPSVTFPGGGGAMGVAGTSDCQLALDVGDFTVASHRTTPSNATTALTLGSDETLNMLAVTQLTSTNDFPSGSVGELKSYGLVVLSPGFYALNGSTVLVHVEDKCPGTSYARTGEIDEVPALEESLEDGDVVHNMIVYPNPSQSIFNIQLELGSDEEVTIEVFDMIGRNVAQLSNGNFMSAGLHSYQWQPEGNGNAYILKVKVGESSWTRQLLRIE